MTSEGIVDSYYTISLEIPFFEESYSLYVQSSSEIFSQLSREALDEGELEVMVKPV